MTALRALVLALTLSGCVHPVTLYWPRFEHDQKTPSCGTDGRGRPIPRCPARPNGDR